MSLADQLLNRLAQPGINGANVEVTSAGDRLLLRVDQSGPLAVTCWELKLSTDRLQAASIDRIKQVAEELTERVTYLLEPLSPVEADAEACVVQMRSTQPNEQDGVRSYYEILVKTGGAISLQRFEAQTGAMRTSVAMTLTKEILGRLATDFLASVE